MATLTSQIESTLSENLRLPEELSLLFQWIEDRGLFSDTDNGRLGFLYPWSKMKSSWTDSGRDGGTDISFAAEGNADLHYWFGHRRPEVLERLYVFARTGADGSMAAFWLDDLGKQRIVHLGSGSGSVMCCVLADTAIDFLRLVAIGDDEIC